VAANTPEPPPDRAPTSEGEVRSAWLRLLRLLAAEVARRVPARRATWGPTDPRAMRVPPRRAPRPSESGRGRMTEENGRERGGRAS
jgi:hypothetical protein